MNIKIIAVGKIKEKYHKSALEEYTKRLGAYCSLSVTEIPAAEIKDESLADKYKQIEGEKIMQSIKPNSFVITMEIKGKMLSSEDFALKIKELAREGNNEVVFVIGGANGLAKCVLDRSDFSLSFSKMTFTHQMFRVLLFEQIYRAFKINNNENYHR